MGTIGFTMRGRGQGGDMNSELQNLLAAFLVIGIVLEVVCAAALGTWIAKTVDEKKK